MNPRVAALSALIGIAACRSVPTPSAGDGPIGEARQAETTVCPSATVGGLDVSDAQGTVDWTSVANTGRVFAFIKATQGDYYTSSSFSSQWSGALAAGFARSPYHFFDPTIDGTAQAQYFLSAVGTLASTDLPPMLDIECPTSSDESQTESGCEYSGDSGWAPGSTISSRIQDFITYVQQQTGVAPILYSYNSWFSDSGAGDSGLLSYPFFVAWPTSSNCYEVGIGNDFTSAAFWQWSFTGTCAGVNGQVDLDYFNGTMDQLEAMTIGHLVGSSSGTGGAGAGGSGSGGGGGGSNGGGSNGGGGGAGGGGGGTNVGSTASSGGSANATGPFATASGTGAGVVVGSATGTGTATGSANASSSGHASGSASGSCACRQAPASDPPMGAALLVALGLAARRRPPKRGRRHGDVRLTAQERDPTHR